MKKKTLISIVGPTAVGKTTLAIDLARHFDCEIISADSRQFFKEMDLGTAKPTREEMARAKHHFVDFLSMEEDYSAGQFERDVLVLLSELFEKRDVAILVGGSGLYVNAVLYGFDELPADGTIRQQLMERLEEEGLESLVAELRVLDPKSAARMDLKNTQRVVRALEVCRASGKPYSSFTSNKKKNRPFEHLAIGLNTDREILYERINTRVGAMVTAGLMDEARKLYPKRALNALKTVGYREWFRHFDGEISEEEAIALIKQNTRRFAKRQLTWFKRNPDTQWFDLNESEKVVAFCVGEMGGNGR